MIKFIRFTGILLGVFLLVITALLALVPGDRTPPSAWIVFGTQRDGDSALYRMRPDGVGQQRLTTYPGSDIDPQWSPDGEWIVFQGWIGSDGEIFRMRADGTDRQNLTNRPLITDYEPQWSPDGQWIMFSATRDTNLINQVYRMRPDGTHQQRLTSPTGGKEDPQWSPDGQWIAFISSLNDRLGLYRMRADGTQLCLITPFSELVDQFQWSPDGRKLVLTVDGSIFRVQTNGLEQRLTHNFKTDWAPQWSPDGEWIMFQSSRDGDVEIFKMRPDGSEQQNLTAYPGRDEYAEWSPPLKRSWFPWLIIMISVGLVSTGLLLRR